MVDGSLNQGAGIKIGIIDDGVDQTHPYFSPAGYTMPAGYPKGRPPTRRRR
jgi:subtilisin family serine protease